MRATQEQACQASDELCQMYAVGEKYQLSGLQKCVITKFESMARLQAPNVVPVLETAKKMYGQISESDTIYRAYFIKAMKTTLEPVKGDSSVSKWIDENAAQDGRLSKDLFTAQREVYFAKERDWSSAKFQLQTKVDFGDHQLRENKKALQRLRDHHWEDHSDDCEWEE